MNRPVDKMLPRAYLHIGTEKTGSTTLQHFFGKNREKFLNEGILYPHTAADEFDNHVGLAAYAAHDQLVDDLRRRLEVSDESTLEQFRRTLERDLRAEIDRHRDRAETLVLSNEHCQSRLSSSEEIQRIADLVRPLAKEIRIVVYLRRQDLMAVSLYSTYLKSGGSRREIFPETPPPHYYNFEHLLDSWAAVFGEDAIMPRIYEPETLNSGDVINDIMSLIGHQVTPGFYRPPRTNESFSAAAQEVVRELNQRGSDRLSVQELQRITDRLASIFSGPGRRPAQHEAQAFYYRFRDSNEKVRARWFSSRSSLFNEDFSRYPEIDDIESLDWSDAADLVVGLTDQRESPEPTDVPVNLEQSTGLFGIFRWLYRVAPIPDNVRRSLRDAVLKRFFPARFAAIYDFLNAPYRGDRRSPDLRDKIRRRFREEAEAKLDAFLASEKNIVFPQADHPRLSIMIVIYNEPGLTFQCLQSLARETHQPFELILVDNASDARTRSLLSRIEGANIVLNEQNLHYIAGVNGALKLVTCENLLLLNNDTMIDESCLSRAMETLENDSEIGAVGASVLSIDGLILENGCAITADGVCHSLERGAEPKRPERASPIKDVDYVSGCFLLTRTRLLKDAGGLDCRYAPAYYDDADYCTLLWEQGHRVVIDHRVCITHFESAASSSEAIARLVDRNRVKFRRKFAWRTSHQARLRAST